MNTADIKQLRERHDNCSRIEIYGSATAAAAHMLKTYPRLLDEIERLKAENAQLWDVNARLRQRLSDAQA